jgi:polar amino acid transport system substrate-binding protein
VDALIEALSDTPQRRARMAMVDYAPTAHGVLVRVGSTLRGSNDTALCHDRVAVLGGTVQDKELRATQCARPITIVTVGSTEQGVNMLLAGKVDALSTDLAVAGYFEHFHPAALRVLGRPTHTGERLGIALPLDSPALQAAVAGAIHGMQATGILTRILQMSGALGLLCAVPGFGARPPYAPSAASLSLVHPGYLTIGTDPTLPPFSYRTRNGKIIGSDIQLARALASLIGLRGIRIVTQPFARLINGLNQHRYDVVLSGMYDTPEREQAATFIDFARGGAMIVTHPGTPIVASSYAGLCGHSVSVLAGSVEEHGLRLASCGTRPMTVRAFPSDQSAFFAFRYGEVEAHVDDFAILDFYAGMSPADVVPSGVPFDVHSYGMAVGRTNMGLQTALQDAMYRMRSTGRLNSMLAGWKVSTPLCPWLG